jgi:hypothetical protein
MVSTAVKRRIFLGVLVVLLIWPLIHYGLSRHYHINHWRFSGFAMYTRPAYLPKIGFAGQLGNRPLTPADLQAALGDDIDRIDAFVEARRLWGELETPEALGRLILARMPALHELKIVINTIGMEPGDDYMSHSAERYRCVRPGAGGGPACTRF